MKEEKNYSKFTVINYGKDLKLFLDFLKCQSIEKINQINYSVLRKYLSFLYEKDYSKKTISRNISTLRSFFKYQMKKNILKKTPCFL